jgi:hypothetical protein
MRTKETPEQRDERRAAAFERGWSDSLRAHDNSMSVPWADKYDYGRGWNACARYRWHDPNGRGVAPDPDWRPPREVILGKTAFVAFDMPASPHPQDPDHA